MCSARRSSWQQPGARVMTNRLPPVLARRTTSRSRPRVAGCDRVADRKDDVRPETGSRVPSGSDGSCADPVVQRPPGRSGAPGRPACREFSAAGVVLRRARGNRSPVVELVRKRARPERCGTAQALGLVPARRLLRGAGDGSPALRFAVAAATRRLDALPRCLGSSWCARRLRRGWLPTPRAEPGRGSCRSCRGRSGWPPRCTRG